MDLLPLHWLTAGLESVQAATGFPDFVNDHGWLWAGGETIHFMGLCLLIGTIGAFDLRMLGVAKAIPIGPLQRLVPWGVVGFLMCLATGVFFLLGNHWTGNAYFNNIAFKWKMALILLAGLNVMLFNLSGMTKAVEAVGAGGSAPALAKIVAATSLVLWVGVIICGRFLPILGDAF